MLFSLSCNWYLHWSAISLSIRSHITKENLLSLSQRLWNFDTSSGLALWTPPFIHAIFPGMWIRLSIIVSYFLILFTISGFSNFLSHFSTKSTLSWDMCNMHTTVWFWTLINFLLTGDQLKISVLIASCCKKFLWRRLNYNAIWVEKFR